MIKRSRPEWHYYFAKTEWHDSFVLAMNCNDEWGVYTKDGKLLNDKRWKDIRVVYDYLFLIDKDGKYSFGHVEDNKLNIIASDLRHINWIDNEIFELTNQQFQKAIYKKGKCIIEYGEYKDFAYEIEVNSITEEREVEIIGIDIPFVLLGKDIVQQSEKGYVVKDGDDYAFYDTNGEMVLDFEYQEIKLFDDHVEATKKIFFD